MANVYLKDSTLTAIGDAIRAKAGNTNLLLPSEMPAAITNLPSGGVEKPYDIFQLNAKGESGRGWLGWKTYFPTNEDFNKIKLLVLVSTSNGRSVLIKENPEWKVATDGSVRVKVTAFFEYSSGNFTVTNIYPYDTSIYYALSFDSNNMISFKRYEDSIGVFGSPAYCGVYLEKYK